MMPDVMRQCVRLACAFRFPGPDKLEFPCPKCGSATNITDHIPNLSPVRTNRPLGQYPHLEIGLDNLRSVFNVGSIFRTADATGIEHVHLFGTSPTPTHPKMDKTALGAELVIPWTQYWDGVSAVNEIKHRGLEIWCLEYSPESKNLFTLPSPDLNKPHLLIVGNENNGIDPKIMALANHTVYLPMMGEKESLNVASAFAVAAYWFIFNWGKNE